MESYRQLSDQRIQLSRFQAPLLSFSIAQFLLEVVLFSAKFGLPVTGALNFHQRSNEASYRTLYQILLSQFLFAASRELKNQAPLNLILNPIFSYASYSENFFYP